MTAVQISRVDKDTVQFIDPVLVLRRDGLVDVVLEINLKGKFMAIVDLNFLDGHRLRCIEVRRKLITLTIASRWISYSKRLS